MCALNPGSKLKPFRVWESGKSALETVMTEGDTLGFGGTQFKKKMLFLYLWEPVERWIKESCGWAQDQAIGGS